MNQSWVMLEASTEWSVRVTESPIVTVIVGPGFESEVPVSPQPLDMPPYRVKLLAPAWAGMTANPLATNANARTATTIAFRLRFMSVASGAGEPLPGDKGFPQSQCERRRTGAGDGTSRAARGARYF